MRDRSAGRMPLGAGWAELPLESDGRAESFASGLRDFYPALEVSDKRAAPAHLLVEWPAEAFEGVELARSLASPRTAAHA